MRRLLSLTTITVIAMLITACGGDSSTGPDPNNGGNGEGQVTTYSVDMTPTPSEGGSVSASADGPYEEGESIELTAEASNEYRFTHWSGDIDSTADNPLSLTVDQNYSLTANFEKKSYALTTNTDGDGAINENVIQQKATDYEHGTVVELIANPADGWKFVEWTGDLIGTDNPHQITVDSPQEVTAVFEKKSYPLTIQTDGQGGVYETVIQQKTTDYDYGTVVELKATPSAGWEFTGWQGDLTGSTNPVQFTVEESSTITAGFELLEESSRPAFYLAENGVTIKCEDASVGDTGTVDGTEYTKRSKSQITPSNAPATCTSSITDMRELFEQETNFNGDISHWDVSGVEDMYSMFMEATSFNGDLSNWDVSSVTNMNRMFHYTESFNGDISNWDVSSVTDMFRMFEGAEAFNGDISSWDVSSVENVSSMFRDASSFNGDLSSWDVSSATTLNWMFAGAKSFNGDISNWDVSNVTYMIGIFSHASAFNQDLSSWDVSGVSYMDNMFQEASSFNQNISDWFVPGICSEPDDFDTGSHEEFEDNTNKQPNWSDTCK